MIKQTVIDTPIGLKSVPTKPIEGQKPGTSGLRKTVKVFKGPHYIENFIQSYFLSVKNDLSPKNVLLVGGDGRYYNIETIFTILRLACANGISEIHVPKNGVMSTPACSAYIRHINAEIGNCIGGILLTASHNPGGAEHDFGIKFNGKNGGPAPEQFTNAVYSYTQHIEEYTVANYRFEDHISLTDEAVYQFTNVNRPLKPKFTIRVVENIAPYVNLMKSLFDFPRLKKMFARKDFTFSFDAMHGVSAPYAKTIFQEELGCSPESLMHCDNRPDFGGLHPDPNLTYAQELVKTMGIFDKERENVPEFGAACDGDADRNMILGKHFFVTPSDSLAVLAANSEVFLKNKIKGVARSMPTSGAVDKVAEKLNLAIYEVPTGWKFFGNLMDTDRIDLCGEESFGTGSNHIREKDGLWTVLVWLQLLAAKNVGITPQGSFHGVQAILKDFWKQFGRNYYCRYDYESCDSAGATKCWNHLLQQVNAYKDSQQLTADIYRYKDPVDKSFSDNQGIRFIYKDGSRVIFRQSGTGAVGMTIRIYFEKYEPEKIDLQKEDALKHMIEFGLKTSNISEFTGKTKPDVIT